MNHDETPSLPPPLDTRNPQNDPLPASIPPAAAARPRDLIPSHDLLDDDGARLRRVGLGPRQQALLAALAAQVHDRHDARVRARRAARVIEVQRDSVTLHDGEQTLAARLLPTLRHELDATDDALAVGDWVIAEHHGHDPWWVAWRLPPVTQLSRRLSDGRDRVSRAVLVSNIDTVLIVMGLDGDFNLRRLERYLALVAAAGVSGVVVLTKADACGDLEARLAAVRRLTPASVDTVAVDTRDTAACEVLAPWLGTGQTLVAVGSSGAGKSTLTNTLTGATQGQATGATRAQPTGATRRGDGRGRHTTTTRSLHLTPGGACLIDTPGIRTLRLDLDTDELAAAFDDIARLAAQCRFRDCRHVDEPDCAVRAAVAPERLRNFHKLQREARRDTMSVLDRQAELAVWRQRSKALRARLADKPR